MPITFVDHSGVQELLRREFRKLFTEAWSEFDVLRI